MKKYKSERNFWGGAIYPASLSIGQIVELPDHIAIKWLKAGWIVEAPKTKKKVVIK